jgi:hypothetical protein
MPAKHRQLVLRLAASGTSLLAYAVLQAHGADLVPEGSVRVRGVISGPVWVGIGVAIGTSG